ncbi:hypothetical protein [Nannocystis pusilla]|uniref:hypothetical protein n=1 Tax=Nannocystis pusilla TaxID=889268 RepID=UPI003B77D7C9
MAALVEADRRELRGNDQPLATVTTTCGGSICSATAAPSGPVEVSPVTLLVVLEVVEVAAVVVEVVVEVAVEVVGSGRASRRWCSCSRSCSRRARSRSRSGRPRWSGSP